MGGCIAITCAETGRYSMFSAALARLEKPAGTSIYMATGSDREQGRNQLVRMMLDSEDDWLLFLDDDQIFNDDLLTRLLAHEVDIVGGLYLRRDLPFTPVCYSERLTDGRYVPLDLAALPQDGLIQCAAVGSGGMLIRRSVFEDMEDPWFIRGEHTEDLIWCSQQTRPIYCDLGARLGHMTTTAVWPSTIDSGWAIGFNISGDVNFYRPL
jgi:hypothetical protein